MTTPHRATPEQWEVVEICREEGKIPWPTAACLLELRARIEELEAAQLEAPMTEPRAASAEARPAGGLVERVALALDSSCPQDEYVINDCRAAIREVAAWLEARGSAHWLSVAVLNREADRG